MVMTHFQGGNHFEDIHSLRVMETSRCPLTKKDELALSKTAKVGIFFDELKKMKYGQFNQ
ncbi:hypothetical protein CRYUN_Cryun10bG0045100 [Craigia yunnanensis]